MLRTRLKGFGLSTRGKVVELKHRLFAALQQNEEAPPKPKRNRLFRASDFVSAEAEEAGSEECFSEEEEEEEY